MPPPTPYTFMVWKIMLLLDGKVRQTLLAEEYKNSKRYTAFVSFELGRLGLTRGSNERNKKCTQQLGNHLARGCLERRSRRKDSTMKILSEDKDCNIHLA